ncbi:MAG: peptidoglycan-binding domain-containing protein [Jaaginema sp. PMC 1079.18]|nr:peptidoglycan-binding domain-containing protein [Jaaginema sp. PMC 1079.18]
MFILCRAPTTPGSRTGLFVGTARPAAAPAPPPTTTAANPTPTPEISPEQVRSLQQRLRAAGFYDGNVDGLWGPQTQEALDNARRVYNVETEDLLKGEF